MKKTAVLLPFFILCLFVQAQVIAGPMLGQVELREARIWLEVAPSVKSVKLQYVKKGAAAKKEVVYKGSLGNTFNPITFSVGGLDINTEYTYGFIIDGKPVPQKGTFTTKSLWQWRQPAPDLTFLAGSCAYFNEPVHDRPGKPYGGDSSIFETMAKEEADFMLWLGDNWYTREVDYYSNWGLWYRAHQTRRQPVLQNFLKRMPHYAMWDDHDYGPNDIGKHYILKEESKKVFDSYWANPSSGHNKEGIYTQLSYSDVDLFMCDDRWWRSADGMKDSVNDRPNRDKRMLGEQQMEWLKNALLHSTATFKIIAIGSQVLNPASAKDKLAAYPVEYFELVNFLADNKIDGVLFFSGDRHHSEVIKVDRPGTYPLFDVTVSSLTAGVVKFSGAEKDSPYRVIGIDENNYGRIAITGAKGQRRLRVEFIGTKGVILGEWSVMESTLKTVQP